MVAGADRAELRLRELRELALWREVGSPDLLEHRVVDPLLRRHTHAERDPAHDLAHDRVDAAERVEVGAGEIGEYGLVAAADVVADTRGRHEALVGHGAADRLRVARVMVSAEDAELGIARLQAPLELLQAPRVHGAEGLDRAHHAPRDEIVVEDTGKGKRHRAGSNRRSARCRRVPNRSATVPCIAGGPREGSNLCARVRSPVLYR